MSMPPMTPEQMATTPAGPLPPGVSQPNFVNPETRAPGATAAIVVFLAVMLIVLTMRMVSKSRISRNLGLDDWMALTAGIFTTAMSAVTIAALNEGGLGPHWWNVPLLDFVNPAFTARLFVLQLVNTWSTTFAKLSILFFLLRLFPKTVRRSLANLIFFGIGLNLLYTVILTLYLGIVCSPRPGGGGQFPAQCSGEIRLQVGDASAAMNLFLDLYVLAIAVPTIATLQMSTRRKIGVILVLGTGLLACLCSVMTIYYRVVTSPTDDPSWNQVPPIVVGMLEPIIAVITACLPALPVLWGHVSTKGTASFRRLLSRISFSQRSHGHEIGDGNSSQQHSSRKTSESELELGPHRPAFQEYKASTLGPTVTSRSDQYP
ncbi:hypothetical protein MMC17_003314 [Xylographa soralifera]|nr:hypothetical protein [Xylographa soralifera]